jgi:hypothetical protein
MKNGIFFYQYPVKDCTKNKLLRHALESKINPGRARGLRAAHFVKGA